MPLTQVEGGCVSLDAHTEELLRCYVEEHNRWLRQLPNDGCPYPPEAISFDEMGRHILARFLHDWAERRKGGRP